MGDVEAARLRLASAGPVAVEYETHAVLSPGSQAELREVREKMPRSTAWLESKVPPGVWDDGDGDPWVMRGILDYGRERALLADDEGGICLVRGSKSMYGDEGDLIADLTPIDFFQPNPLWLIGLLRGASVEAQYEGYARLRSSPGTTRSDPGLGRLARRFRRPSRLPVDCALDEQKRLAWIEGHNQTEIQRFRLQFNHDARATAPEDAWSSSSLVAPLKAQRTIVDGRPQQ